MLKLGIDFDGVVQDSSFLKQEYCKTKFGIEIPIAQGKRGYLVSNKILTDGQYDQMVNDLYETELGLEAKVVKNADEVLGELANEFEITIVTSRSPLGVQMAQKWLDQNKIIGIKIIGTDNKEKLTALSGFDYYIDDDLSKLMPLLNQVDHLYLFSWEYNMHEELPSGIKRVNGWKELRQLVRI